MIARPARPGAGGVHDAGAAGARRARRRRRDRRPRRPRARRASEAELEQDTNVERNLEVLREFAAREPRGQAAARRPPVLRLARRRSSARSASRESSSSATARARTSAAASAPSPTDERETLPCGLVFRSVGYRGVALPGVPFDERAARSRTRAAACSARRRAVPGVYCAGWIKRGPTRRDRHEQEGRDRDRRAAARGRRGRAASAASDGDARPTSTRCSRSAASTSSSTPGWTAIDEAERAAGEPWGRPRVKLCPGTDLARRRARIGAPVGLRATHARRPERALARGAIERGTAGNGSELWGGRRRRRSRTSPSPASRFPRPSRAGSDASRAPPRA